MNRKLHLLTCIPKSYPQIRTVLSARSSFVSFGQSYLLVLFVQTFSVLFWSEVPHLNADMSIGTRTKFPGILKTLLLLQVFCFFVCLEAFQPRRPEHLHGQLDGKLEKRRPVPISLEDSPHNLTTASVDLQLGLINLRHNLRKRAVDFQHYICKGERALNMIVHDPPAIRTWTREDFTRSGWSTYNDANSVSADLVPALNGLGVPHAPQDIRPVFANHFNEFTDRNGKIAVSVCLHSIPCYSL